MLHRGWSSTCCRSCGDGIFTACTTGSPQHRSQKRSKSSDRFKRCHVGMSQITQMGTHNLLRGCRKQKMTGFSAGKTAQERKKRCRWTFGYILLYTTTAKTKINTQFADVTIPLPCTVASHPGSIPLTAHGRKEPGNIGGSNRCF